MCPSQQNIIPTVAHTVESNLDYAQGNKFKITIINMANELKENMNKFWMKIKKIQTFE